MIIIINIFHIQLICYNLSTDYGDRSSDSLKEIHDPNEKKSINWFR